MNYVTYDDTGKLTGAYLQDLQPEHEAAYIEVAEEVRAAWVLYRANDARNGVELADAPEPVAPAVPAQVTMRQAQLALLAAGKLSAVDAALDNLPSPQREIAQVEWRAARDVERASPIVALLGAALNLDDAALDALFVDAATR